MDSASQSPIGVATVGITDAKAAVLLARTSTGTDGGFRVQGLRPGRYGVRVFAIGYAPRELAPVALGPGSSSVDVGTVSLTASPIELQSLEVTSQQADVQLAPDRNTYVVRDMPTTKGGTALDVLRNVPSVDVDIDNSVSLRGNSGVVVQINGRPSPMKAAQLGNFLAQLPADIVDKVEVIPNPSAREDPTGVAGIINIVLKRRTDPGLSGTLTLSGATTGHADVGGSLGYRRGPLSLHGSYGFFRENRSRTDSIFRANRYLRPVTFLDESAFRHQRQNGHTLTTTAGYQLGKQDELSLESLFTTRGESESYDALYRDLDSARALAGLSDRLTLGSNRQYNLESTLGYQHSFRDKEHTLSSELRIVREQEDGPQHVRVRTLALNGTPIDTTVLESQTALDHGAETSLQLDYVRPLAGMVQLEAGYKGSLQRFHTALGTQVFDTALAAYLPDSSRTSDFTYHQDVHAIYALLDAQPGKFQLQGGARVERASTQFHLRTLRTTYDNRYYSVFPSALVAYDFDDAHQIKLSYSTRIKRPDDTDLLDPTPFYVDPLNRSIGNPFLKPEHIRAFELGLQRNGSRTTIQLTPYYRRTLDAVRQIRTIDTAGVVTRTFANVATSDAYGADGTIALHGGRLTGFLSATAFGQVNHGAASTPGLSYKTFGWSARTNASIRFSSTLDVQALVSYQAPMTVEQGRIAGRTRFSLAARQKLMRDQMSVTLRVIDPFNTSRERLTTSDSLFYQVSNRRRAIRGLLLSINWTFGNQEGKKKEPDNLLNGAD